jgi:hypothetical protein
VKKDWGCGSSVRTPSMRSCIFKKKKEEEEGEREEKNGNVLRKMRKAVSLTK